LNKPHRRRVRFSQKDKNGKPRILKNEMLGTKNSQVSTVKIESEKKLTKTVKEKHFKKDQLNQCHF
jgi:hypothetical protein